MLPKTYQKLVSTKLTKNFREAAQIVEAELHPPKPDEIIVRNIYAGVNATDPNIAAGLYTPGMQPPIELGAEAVGEVAAVGENVTSFKVGDPVMTLRTGGGYREYLPINAHYAIPIQAATPEALTLILSGLTASFGLEIVGEMGKGETVLITAAAGGTGHIAVQLAKLAGNHVIGTCGSPEKAEMLKTLGCDRVVNYREENLDQVLKQEYPNGVNLVYESVGREMFDIAVKRLATKGRLVIIGYISEYTAEPEQITEPRIYTRLLFKSASVRSMFLNHFFEHMPAHMARLTQLLQEGKLKIHIDPTLFEGMGSIVEAVEYLHSGRNNGKVIIRYGTSG